MNLENMMMMLIKKKKKSQTQRSYWLHFNECPENQIHGDRKRMSGCQGLGEGRIDCDLNGNRVFLKDDENVLELEEIIA